MTDLTDYNDPLNPLSDNSLPGVNPASGLPMINDAIDVAGNPYGTDSLHDWLDTQLHDNGISGFDDF